ncbi:MAG TPA: alternative ribosome rescue aminoacyl-tRNA hydrolase ArfB [Gemmatimonadales bacterium]|jgi:ribosome-associated protein|nr:alternative ribosome rescue aminoacyl-tRNA hydrolase ArfB [Gemmatimonadales bacterium]
MDDDRSSAAGALRITDALAIPLAELEYRATRSGGPGGQHVNTSATRVELVWDVARSAALDDATRARLLGRLANRLDSTGRLRLVSSGSRSQFQNREDVTARLVGIVARALTVPKPRKRTRPTAASKARRLERKRRRGALKRERRAPADDE